MKRLIFFISSYLNMSYYNLKMYKKFFLAIFIALFTTPSLSKGYDVFGIGLFDVKFDGSATNQATDFRYERRFDNSLIEIGPEDENFFYLKPFLGFEITSDSANYFLGGIYIEDNLGTIFVGEESNYRLTPSFGIGYYDDGNGKKLGNTTEFRTGLEISYQLKNENRIGLSFSHISNANLGDKNPGVEIISLSYQIPFN
mgnify:CR=1 FL=1